MQSVPSRLKTFSFLLFLSLFTSLSFAQSGIDEGVLLFDEGKLSEAKSFFEKHLKSNKKDAEANFYLGRIYFDENEYGKATDWIGKAAKYDSKNSKYFMWLGHSFGRRTQEASKIRQPFLARNSRKNYEKAIEMDPKNVEARESAMEFYLQAPGFLGGGRDKAEAQAKAISELDEVAGFISWGRVYTYYDETDKALDNYLNANELFPNEMTFHYRLFNFYFAEGAFESAAEIAQKQLSLNDTTAVIYLNLGNAQQRYEQYDAAYSNYLKALDIDPEMNNVLYQIGRLAAVSNMYVTEGEESLIKFISLGDKINKTTLAWAYYRLGTIYENKKEIEAAKDQYQMALKKDKGHKEAKEALARVK